MERKIGGEQEEERKNSAGFITLQMTQWVERAHREPWYQFRWELVWNIISTFIHIRTFQHRTNAKNETNSIVCAFNFRNGFDWTYINTYYVLLSATNTLSILIIYVNKIHFTFKWEMNNKRQSNSKCNFIVFVQCARRYCSMFLKYTETAVQIFKCKYL